MYPSEDDPTYGTFVHTFRAQMKKEGFDMTQDALIRGRGKSVFDKIIKYLRFFREVIVSVRQNDYDLIYVHYIGHSLLPLLFVHNTIRKPLVLNAHGSDILSTSRIKRYIQSLVTPIIKNADLVVVPSKYFQNIIYHRFQIKKNKIFISPSGGIDTTIFKPLCSKKKSNDEFVIGYVSRIEEGKGWEILLNAIKELLTHDIENFRVLIIGGGSQEKELLKMLKMFNIQKYIDFIGRVPHEALVSYYQKMDVFVFPSTLNESLGLVGLEAMACGVPVIGSDIGGLKSYIDNGYNGYRFEAGNSHALSHLLQELILRGQKHLSKLKKNAVATAQQYDAVEVGKKIGDKLRETIDRQ